jgi:hypothetical protein
VNLLSLPRSGEKPSIVYLDIMNGMILRQYRVVKLSRVLVLRSWFEDLGTVTVTSPWETRASISGLASMLFT